MFGNPIFVKFVGSVALLASTVAAAAPAELTVGYFSGGPGNVLDWVAAEQGFFAKRDLDVKLDSFASGPASLAAAMSGAVQIFVTSPSLTTPLHSRGQCMTYVAPGHRNAYDVVGRSDLKWPNAGKSVTAALSDLKGRSIGIIARGSATDRVVVALLEYAGLSTKDVTIIPVGAGATAAAALQAKQVDALLVYPPLAQSLPAGSSTVIAQLSGKTSADNPLRDVLVQGNAVSCKFAREEPNTVKRYCQAIWDAFDFANDSRNTGKVVEAMSKYMKTSREAAKNLWEVAQPMITRPEVNEASWQAQSKFLPERVSIPPYEESVYAPCLKQDPRR